MPNFMPVGSDRLWLPEPLRWDAERPVEARGCVLPRDDHRQLGNGVVVVVSLHAREKLVVDVAVRLRDRIGVFERHLLRVAEERALRIVVERLDLLRRDAVPAAHGRDRKSTRLNSSHRTISYAVFCLKKKKSTSQYRR